MYEFSVDELRMDGKSWRRKCRHRHRRMPRSRGSVWSIGLIDRTRAIELTAPATLSQPGMARHRAVAWVRTKLGANSPPRRRPIRRGRGLRGRHARTTKSTPRKGVRAACRPAPIRADWCGGCPVEPLPGRTSEVAIRCDQEVAEWRPQVEPPSTAPRPAWLAVILIRRDRRAANRRQVPSIPRSACQSRRPTHPGSIDAVRCSSIRMSWILSTMHPFSAPGPENRESYHS